MTTYILQHSFEPWILPPGIFILIALLGLIIYRWCRRSGLLLIIISILSLWLGSMPVVAYNLIEALQNRYPALKINHSSPQIFTHGAIVVLGSGVGISVEKNNELAVTETTLNRLYYGVRLHKQLHLPLVVSGGPDKGASVSEADLMLKVLHDDFQIESAIREDKSITTSDEAKFLVSILKENHIDGVYLVTNAWHMPRSVESFTRAHIRVIPAPMGYQVYDHDYTLLSFLPNIQALHTTTIALHEWIGIFWYRMNKK